MVSTHNGTGKKAILIIFIIIVLLLISIISIISYLIIFPGATLNANETMTDNPEILMQNFMNSCISNELGNNSVVSFLGDNVELCESFESKNDCEFIYYVLNVLSGNYFNNCDGVDNQEAKNFCISLKNNDASNCEKISYGANRIACRAILSDDISICNQTINEREHKECMNIFYVRKGMMFNDSNFCENMQELEEKYKYSWFSSQKQWCIFLVSKNPTVFENKIKERCEEQFTGMILNQSLCYLFISEDGIRACMNRISGVLSCKNRVDSISCIDNFINIDLFCEDEQVPISEISLVFHKYIFLRENPNICTSRR